MPNCRCCKCDRRRTLTRNQEALGLAGPKCVCKSSNWRIDNFRMKVEKKRPPCNCGMYPFPHRMGGGICLHNKNLTEEDFENAIASMRVRKIGAAC